MNKYFEKIDQWTRLSHLSFPVPTHSNQLAYSLGGITLFGFILLFISGLFMTQFFNPQPEHAAESIRYLVEKVTGGGWIRSFHYWVAQAVVISMCIHLIRVFISGSYKSPRRLTWFFGIALFFTTFLLAFFSGTVIKWDQEAYEALIHYDVVMGMLGPLGEIFGSGLTDSVSMNMRMYVFHIVLVPLLLIALIIAHFYLVHVFNISPLPKGPHSNMGEVPKEELKGDFLEHVWSILRFSLIFYGLVAVLAIFVYAPLEGPPTPQESGTKPPWIYYWQYGVENIVGIAGIIYSSLVLLAFLLIVPFIDRGTSRNPADRKVVLSLGGFVAAVMVGFSIYAWVTPPQVHGGGHGRDDHHGETPSGKAMESHGEAGIAEPHGNEMEPRGHGEDSAGEPHTKEMEPHHGEDSTGEPHAKEMEPHHGEDSTGEPHAKEMESHGGDSTGKPHSEDPPHDH